MVLRYCSCYIKHLLLYSGVVVAADVARSACAERGTDQPAGNTTEVQSDHPAGDSSSNDSSSDSSPAATESESVESQIESSSSSFSVSDIFGVDAPVAPCPTLKTY